MDKERAPFLAQKLERAESLKRQVARMEGDIRLREAITPIGKHPAWLKIISLLQSTIQDLTSRMVARNVKDEISGQPRRVNDDDRRELAADVRARRDLANIVAGAEKEAKELRKALEHVKADLEREEHPLPRREV